MIDRPGFEDKVFYVWFDAPIEYIGATAEWAAVDPEHRDWRSWWYDADDVEYTQFMAKDNVPFHTVSFPVTLIGSREPWTRAHQIKGFNWLTYYGGKFSTSQGRGVFMDQALDTFPADLLALVPLRQRARVERRQLHLGRLHRRRQQGPGRLLRQPGQPLPHAVGQALRRRSCPAGGAPGEREAPARRRTSARSSRAYTELMAAKELRKSANELRRGWALANAYWEQSEPWKVVKADPDAAAVIFRTVINVVRVLAVLASPIIPTSSATVLEALGATDSTWPDGDAIADELAALAPGHPVAVPPVLFAKITDEQKADAGGALRRPGGLAAPTSCPPPPPPPPPPTEPPPPPPPLDDGAVDVDAVELASIGAMWT